MKIIILFILLLTLVKSKMLKTLSKQNTNYVYTNLTIYDLIGVSYDSCIVIKLIIFRIIK